MKLVRQFIKGFKRGMGDFGQTISIIINSALLFVVYFIGVGITSVLAKVVGKHFIKTKISKKSKTYWSDLNLKKKPLEEYYRQF